MSDRIMRTTDEANNFGREPTHLKKENSSHENIGATPNELELVKELKREIERTRERARELRLKLQRLEK